MLFTPTTNSVCCLPPEEGQTVYSPPGNRCLAGSGRRIQTEAVCVIHSSVIYCVPSTGVDAGNAVVNKKMTQPLSSMCLQFKNQQRNKQSFNFERKPGLEAVFGPRNQTHATEEEGPHQPWRGLNLYGANLAGCSLGSGEPHWASESPWIQRLFPALVCCLLFCKQHHRASPFHHHSPPDRGYLFLVTSLRIPGGVASRTWMGLVSLAGACLPFPAQGRSWRIRNCISPLPSPSPPLPAAT